MRTPDERRHLVRSPYGLRALATLFTLTTFAGSSAFAAGHLHNPSAPLQPSAAAGIAPTGLAGDGEDQRDDDRPAATPAPSGTPTTRSRTRTTITPGVGTTTRGARTRTRQS